MNDQQKKHLIAEFKRKVQEYLISCTYDKESALKEYKKH
jgi:hypothetical protein